MSVFKKSRFNSLEEFSILEEIGKGGYSKVYLVEDKKTKRKYALKAAYKNKKGKDRTERTLREIKVLKRLKHPNIIKIKGSFEDTETIYLVLEYIEGRDCAKFFKGREPITKEQIKKIIRQLVQALTHCHEKGIIHRDVKLQNILVDDDFNIKLTDFGLCAIKENKFDMLESTLGTVHYTAPEMLEGIGYNESVDVWAIGIILFMLLTKKYPYDGVSRQDIFDDIREKTIHYSKLGLERKEIKLLKALLQKDPEERIEVEEILSVPFFK